VLFAIPSIARVRFTGRCDASTVRLAIVLEPMAHPTERGNALLAAQAGEHDADLLLG